MVPADSSLHEVRVLDAGAGEGSPPVSAMVLIARACEAVAAGLRADVVASVLHEELGRRCMLAVGS